MGRIFADKKNPPKKRVVNLRAGLSGDIQRTAPANKTSAKKKTASSKTMASIEKAKQAAKKRNTLPRAGLSGDIQSNRTPSVAKRKKKTASSKTLQSIERQKAAARKDKRLPRAGISGDVPHSFPQTRAFKVDLPDYIIPDPDTPRPLTYEYFKKWQQMKANGTRLLIDDPQYKTWNPKELEWRRRHPFVTVEDYNRNQIIKVLHDYGENPSVSGAFHAATWGLLDDGEIKLKALGATQSDFDKLQEIKDSVSYKDGQLMTDIATTVVPIDPLGKLLGKGKTVVKIGETVADKLTPFVGEAGKQIGPAITESVAKNLLVAPLKHSQELNGQPGKEEWQEYLKNIASDIGTDAVLSSIEPAIKGAQANMKRLQKEIPAVKDIYGKTKYINPAKNKK